MPHINTLVEDIYATVKAKSGITKEAVDDLAGEVARRIGDQFADTHRRGTLRLSGMGLKCPRHLWYEVNHPELAEQLPPWATIKYSYGHILEAMAITLAKSAGHEVTGEQDELVVDGVKGHRDCVIDGCIVDVKSASSRAFQKFKDKSIAQNDSFGYLDQLDGYLVGSLEDPIVRVKDKAYLLAIDKQLGHMVLYEHRIREESIRSRIKHYKSIVALDVPPKCECGTTPDGKSGNIRLDVRASYSSFKHECFPNLRTFLYSDGPRYLTKVVRLPDVPEIDKHGRIIYSG